MNKATTQYDRTMLTLEIYNKMYSKGLALGLEKLQNIAYNNLQQAIKFNRNLDPDRVLDCIKGYCDRRTSYCLKDEKERNAMRSLLQEFKK
tara:strand:- start:1018 stop:1290 length:273 start_codon:yes stop_codon:yes gene_type:complete